MDSNIRQLLAALTVLWATNNLETVGFLQALSISWKAPEHPYLWLSTGYWGTKE